ncbi:MAG: Dabb family protein [Gammaproteobacteria bacterium]
MKFPSYLFLLTLVFSQSITGCALPNHSNANDTIHHIVLLWLKSDAEPDIYNQIIDETTKLAEIDEIKAIRVGRSITSNRTIVDDSFSLGIAMQFNNKQEMQRYLDDPRHVTLVETYIKPNISRIVVYDF